MNNMSNSNFIENDDEKILTEQEEQTEQAEDTAEVTQEPKLYSESELNERVNKLLGPKIARREAKIRKEFESEYGGLVEVLKAGTGLKTVKEIKEGLTDFYGQRGVKISDKQEYSAKDIERLARAEADDIISAGYDEVVDEVNRLSQIGVEKMSARDKLIFKTLAEYRQSADRSKALSELGVTEDVYNSEEFKSFAGKFNPATPIAEVWDIYTKTQPKKEIRTAGSMKQSQDYKGVKEYYSPEEIERLTEEDLDDPKVWEAVRRSMTGR